MSERGGERERERRKVRKTEKQRGEGDGKDGGKCGFEGHMAKDIWERGWPEQGKGRGRFRLSNTMCRKVNLV